ncbi:MAG: hypothetical protein AAGJ82_14050 [Bacteroidota bacterium]
MRQYLNWFWCASVLVFALGSCAVEDDPPINIPFVEQEFVLNLWEDLTDDPNNVLEIKLLTVANEPCLNTTILTEFSRSNQDLKVTLFDILDPENCVVGEAPAQGSQALGGVTETGVYQLEIELKDLVTNTGQLTVQPDYYEVEMSESSGISWTHQRLYRIPKNALWGFITYTNGEQQSLAANWLNELADFTSFLEVEPGYYGYFNRTDATELTITGAPELVDQVTFLVEFDGQMATLESAVADLQAQATEGLEFRIFDDKGNVW